MRFFKNFDFFACNPYVYLANDKKTPTVVGTCLSILMITISIYSFILFIENALLSQNPRIISEEKVMKETKNYFNFTFFFTFSNNSFLRASNFSIKNGNSSGSLSSQIINDCSSFLDKEFFFSKEDFSCLQIENPKGMPLNKINFSFYSMSFLTVNLMFWDFHPTYFSFDQNKIPTPRLIKFYLNSKVKKTMNLYFKKTEMYFDKNLFFSNIEHEDILTYIYGMEKYDDDAFDYSSKDISFDISFYLNGMKTTMHKSIATNLIDVFAKMGGFLFLIYNLINILISPLLKCIYTLTLLSEMIEFRFPADKNEKEKSPSDKCEKIVAKHEKVPEVSKPFEIKNEFIAELKIVKSRVLNISEAKQFFGNIAGPPFKIFKIVFSLRSFLCYLFWKFNRFKRDSQFIIMGLGKLQEILDLKLLVKKVYAIDFIKESVLDKHQIALFNKFNSIYLEIPANPQNLAKNSILSTKWLDWKELSSEIIEGYEEISKKRQISENDIRVLSLLDTHAKKLLNKFLI